MRAAVSSPILAVLVKLGPLDAGRIADLRPYFDSVPDPRARRGRWYSLTAILLVCACAVVSGARSIDEIAEWGQRASNALLAVIGIRRHLLRWRRAPSPATIGRVLGAVDGDALDRAVGAYMGRTASCFDNAVAESFRAVLKEEIGTRFRPDRTTARADIFNFIETFYNRRRLRKHIHWGYLTPHETRLRYRQDQALAA